MLWALLPLKDFTDAKQRLCTADAASECRLNDRPDTEGAAGTEDRPESVRTRTGLAVLVIEAERS